MAGFGGQGVITMGSILGRAAVLHDGRHAVLTEDYGPEKTGGWSRADLVVSDEPVGYPIVERPGAFVAMCQDGFDRFRASIAPGARVLVERDLVRVPDGWAGATVPVAARATATALGKRVVANIVMIGALVETVPVVTVEAARRAILESVPKGTEPLNEAAFARGRELAREAIA